MFYIVPYIDFKLKSDHSKKVILKKFCSSVNVLKTLSLTKTSSYRDFEGTLFNDGFNLRRNVKIGYSAFLPILSCTMNEEKGKVDIKVKIKFHKYVNIGIVASFLFQFSLFSLDFYSIILSVLPYLVIISLFNIEVKALIEKFDEII